MRYFLINFLNLQALSLSLCENLKLSLQAISLFKIFQAQGEGGGDWRWVSGGGGGRGSRRRCAFWLRFLAHSGVYGGCAVGEVIGADGELARSIGTEGLVVSQVIDICSEGLSDVGLNTLSLSIYTKRQRCLKLQRF